MNKTYAIKNWEHWFENAQSTRYKNISWVPIPNKHDGKGYRRITILPDGNNIIVFTAWVLLVQIASKMPVRGVLADETGALDFEDFEAMTGYPSTMFQTAIPFLLHKKIDWLEVVNSSLLGACSEQTHSPTPRKEEKRTEENKKEEKSKDVIPEVVKEIKHKYGVYKHVLLTDIEHGRLIKNYGAPAIKDLIKVLDEYIQEKGFKSKDHNLTIQKWAPGNGYKKKTKAEVYDEELTVCTDALKSALRECEPAEFERQKTKAKEKYGNRVFKAAMEFVEYKHKNEVAK